MNPKTVEILGNALALVREGFCADAYAKNSQGRNVGSCSSDATKWCIAGAIDCVVQHDETAFHETWQELCRLAGSDTKKLISRFSGFNQRKAVNYLEKVLGIHTTKSEAAAVADVVATLDLTLGE